MARSLFFSLSSFLCLASLIAGYSSGSNILQTKVTLAEGGHSEGSLTSSGGELYHFSLKHRDAPNSPFLQRYKSRHEFLQTVLRRDEVRAKSVLDHMEQRRPRQATGMATDKEFVAMDAGSPPAPATLHETRETGALLPPEGAGEYYTELYIGTPRQLQVAMVDLGSDVVWMGEPSSRLRKRRIDGLEPVNSHFYPSSSSSFTPIPGTSDACLTIHGVHVCGNRDACRVVVGTENHHYPGMLEFAYEDLRLNRTDQYKGRYFVFCVGKTNLPTSGILGLGRGRTSFATQVNSNRFAYCLADTDEPSGSSLVFGAGAADANLQFTPLVHHPHVETFYFVNLVGVAVNGVKLPIPSRVLSMDPQGNGGTIIDMSTRFTRFPKSAFDHLVRAVKARIELRSIAVRGFHLCYSMKNSEILRVPSVTLLFENGARMSLPMENLFVSASEQEDVMCLAMVPGSPDTASIIGSLQQQNFLMVFDREKSRLGFAPRQCVSLPNSW